MPEAARKFDMPAALKNIMLAYGQSDTDHEVCGLLGGTELQAASFYPVKNIAADTASEFLMDPEQHIEAIRSMRLSGESLVGIFHTHPDSPAVPSAEDLQQAAYPGTVYLILSLADRAPVLKAYYYDGQKFSKELTLPD